MIPFSPPHIDQAIIDEVVDTLQSGWITTGPKVQRFENNLQEYIDCKEVVCFNSATAGLELALWWYGIGPGDEVIVPAYTYCATANVVEHLGATPVMVDIEPNGFHIDFNQVQKKITAKTKAIIPVDIAGVPCDYTVLRNLINTTNWSAIFKANTPEQKALGRPLILIDAAHSIGATFEGVKQGNLFDMASFSFHAVKNLTTAEGGALAINLPEHKTLSNLKPFFKKASLHGQSKDAFSKLQPGAWRYDVDIAGYKCNMTDIQASIGLVELDRYEASILEKRKALVENYDKLIEGDNLLKKHPHFFKNKTSSFHLYILKIEGVTEQQRDAIITECASVVSLNVHYLPLPELSYYKNKGYKTSDYPNAEKKYKQIISLPLYYTLSFENQALIIETIRKALKRVS